MSFKLEHQEECRRGLLEASPADRPESREDTVIAGHLYVGAFTVLCHLALTGKARTWKIVFFRENHLIHPDNYSLAIDIPTVKRLHGVFILVRFASTP